MPRMVFAYSSPEVSQVDDVDAVTDFWGEPQRTWVVCMGGRYSHFE